jgi:thymidylate synthase
MVKFKETVAMHQYYNLLVDVLHRGTKMMDRTGTGCIEKFGGQIRFDLQEGFPLVAGKAVPFKLVASELLWFLSGSTNNNDLKKLNKNSMPTIWEEWQMPDGNLGPIYGKQWRNWGGGECECNESVDQIKALVRGLQNNPFSRRHIISAWNVSDLPEEKFNPQLNVQHERMALAPCHVLSQYHVAEYDGIKFLSCHMYQRSADLFLGVPFNIASYALLTHMLAHVCGMEVGELIISFGSAHIYNNHVEQVKELLSRDLAALSLPRLSLNKSVEQIEDFKMTDINMFGYSSFSAIKAEVAI